MTCLVVNSLSDFQYQSQANWDAISERISPWCQLVNRMALFIWKLGCTSSQFDQPVYTSSRRERVVGWKFYSKDPSLLSFPPGLRTLHLPSVQTINTSNDKHMEKSNDIFSLNLKKARRFSSARNRRRRHARTLRCNSTDCQSSSKAINKSNWTKLVRSALLWRAERAHRQTWQRRDWKFKIKKRIEERKNPK